MKGTFSSKQLQNTSPARFVRNWKMYPLFSLRVSAKISVVEYQPCRSEP